MLTFSQIVHESNWGGVPDHPHYHRPTGWKAQPTFLGIDSFIS